MRVFVFCFLGLISSKANNQGLYKDEDLVQILNQDNFHSTLKDEKEFWLVEFYASWCGHCVHFAPTIKNFAQEIQNWTRLVNFGVLDCGNPDNRQICSDNAISGYPTIKYFLPGARNFTAPSRFEARTAESMRSGALKLIQENNIQKSVAVNFDDISNDSELEEQLNEIKSAQDFKFTALVIGFEIAKPGIGFGSLDLLADFSSFSEIAARRVDNSPEIVSKYEIEKLPAILILETETSKEIYRTEIEDNVDKPRSDYLDQISTELKLTPSYQWEKHVAAPDLKDSKSDFSYADFDQSKVYIQDIESALLSLLFYDVTDFPLTGDSLSALQKFSKELSKVYPSTSRKTDQYLRDLSDQLSEVEKVKKRKDWISLLNKAGLTQLQGENPKLEYAACTPSIENRRGYTCGLWTLMHFSLAHSGDSWAHPMAEALSDVIINHFSCLDCRENFKKEIQQFPLEDITDTDSGIIWLWSLHNSVNKRLAGDETEDPEFPKIQFPSAKDCPKCQPRGSTFDSTEVVKFLKTRFSFDNLVLFDGEEFSISSKRIEEEDDEIMPPPSKHRVGAGWIWFLVSCITIGLLWLWRKKRAKWALRRSYHKFKHQL